MKQPRLTLSQAKCRLREYPHLERILRANNWPDKVYKKPYRQWPLWLGWLSTNEKWAQERLSGLDSALGVLESKVAPEVWNGIVRKMRAPSDRDNSKGVLAELSVWLFLANVGFPFQLEVTLQGGTNVDVQVMCETGDMFIEVQWISPSQKSDKAASVAAQYGSVASWDWSYEKKRIQQKIYDKISKMTSRDITLVALDYSMEPPLGNHSELSPIGEAVTGLFSEKPPSWASEVVAVVDGVIWFEWDVNFFPVTRWAKINPYSSFANDERLVRFVKRWQTFG